MEKINVWRIAIEDNKIIVYPEEGKARVFSRDKVNAYIDAREVKQIQVFKDYALILPEEPYFCEVDEEHNRLFCGKEPEKVMIL